MKTLRIFKDSEGKSVAIYGHSPSNLKIINTKDFLELFSGRDHWDSFEDILNVLAIFNGSLKCWRPQNVIKGLSGELNYIFGK